MKDDTGFVRSQVQEDSGSGGGSYSSSSGGQAAGGSISSNPSMWGRFKETISYGSARLKNGLQVNSQTVFPGRNGALNQAKRDAGILRSRKPDFVESVPMRQPSYAGEHVIKDASGNIIYTRQYHYTNKLGERVVIQEHSAPHIGSNEPHFNVRPITDLRNGIFPGTKEHYPFQK